MKAYIANMFGIKKGSKNKTPGHTCQEAQPECAFWVNNGPVARTMNELVEALRTMSDEQFDYHTKRDGNDFSRWIGEALQDTACANAIRRVRTRAGMLKALERHTS